ncbi:MAG: hypothetical protein F6K30_08760, partial [Cyanothece sp. SIO2G6]|nr:hypothetical protein [Cyanothece sp. SIO2G6]
MFSVQNVFTFSMGTILMLGLSGNAQAFSIYASDSSGRVGTVDPGTGEFSSVLQSGTQFTDIAITEEGSLFGTSFTGLYSIDQSAGLTTFIGNYGFSGMNALGFTGSNALYGARNTGGVYQIDASTGSSALLAGTSGFRSSGDIVFDPTQNLFWGTSTS